MLKRMCSRISKHSCGFKGQIALENIVVFALVILFLTVTLIILWQIGVFKPFIQRRGWVGFSQITPVDWVVAHNNSAYVKFKNEAAVTVLVHDYGVGLSMGRVECAPRPDESILLRPQDTILIEFTCTGSPSIQESYTLGEYYEAEVYVNYTNVVSGAHLESVGKLYGHIEEPWSVLPGVTTTTLYISKCNLWCPDPGSFSVICEPMAEDPDCPYCNLDRRCVPQGMCDVYCEADEDCELSPDEGPNPCEWCNLSIVGPGGLCKEKRNETDKCGLPCWHPRGFPDECEMVSPMGRDCRYCWEVWSQPLSMYVQTCEENDSCGASCDEYDFYTECSERCLYCNTSLEFGYRCEQGDCGKHCTSDDPSVEECFVGCYYCDVYPEEEDGDPASYVCEEGDCGDYCVDSSTCWEGCEVCYDHRCVFGDLAVSITASNDSGNNLVNINETIYLNVTGTAKDGMYQLLVSDSINVSLSAGPSFNCLRAIANSSTGKQAIEYNVGEITDPWVDAPDIPWRAEPFLCPGATECGHIWTTNESFEARFCYYAIGRESSVTGEGRWSRIAADWVDVGYLKVILVHPKPEVVP
jgi:hypothetical protein